MFSARALLKNSFSSSSETVLPFHPCITRQTRSHSARAAQWACCGHQGTVSVALPGGPSTTVRETAGWPALAGQYLVLCRCCNLTEIVALTQTPKRGRLAGGVVSGDSDILVPSCALRCGVPATASCMGTYVYCCLHHAAHATGGLDAAHE